MAIMHQPAPIRPPRLGALVISLDLELFWGMRHVTTLQRYGAHIVGVREVLPRMLHMFDEHRVHCTMATVGFVFCADRAELLRASPATKPTYVRRDLSPYTDYLSTIGTSEADDPWHFGASLIETIKGHAGHEIGCHSFSHYFCLEDGQTAEQFEADLRAAIDLAQAKGIRLNSMVFPMNQVNPAYLAICRKHGIVTYRGTETSWLHAPRSSLKETTLRRGFRMLDTWLDLSGSNCHPFPSRQHALPMNLPASRFLRPWNPRLNMLEGLRLKRITKAMDHAARTGTIFHLWWHPHNFGVNIDQNMAFLGKVLLHFEQLRKAYGMESLTMGEVADKAQADA